MAVKNVKKVIAYKLLVAGVACLAGCQQLSRPGGPSSALLGGGEPPAKISRAQEADVQIALGRAAEKRGDLDQARAAYLAALERDRNRADAFQRLAILHDKRGQFRESAEYYRQALEADPGNPEIYCDMGYSLYLQRRWAEAEMNLRQVIALDAEHRRAHVNLGMVLAHGSRAEDAVAEFRKGGCDEADARENVAFARTTERDWREARRQYQLALQTRPDSETARARLRELDALVAKVDSPSRPGATTDRAVVATSATSPAVAGPRPSAPRATSPVAATVSPAAAVRPVLRRQVPGEASPK